MDDPLQVYKMDANKGELKMSGFKPTVRFYRMSREVTVVAKKGVADDWSAYVCVCTEELTLEKVKELGSKIRYNLAKIMFPEMDKLYEWRS